jgi:hypothetical protein
LKKAGEDIPSFKAQSEEMMTQIVKENAQAGRITVEEEAAASE